MPRRRVSIKAIEIVRLIRSGMTDARLMEKYNLSAGGLTSLFEQLVNAGILNESELSERASLAAESVILDTEEESYPLPVAEKPVIDAEDALRLIKEGVDDATLMRKYHISAKGLESLIRKLVDSKILSRRDLNKRLSLSGESVVVDEHLQTETGAGSSPPPVEASGAPTVTGLARSADRTVVEEPEFASNVLNSSFTRMVELGLIPRWTPTPEASRDSPVLQIKNIHTGKVVFREAAASLADLVEKAVRSQADLSHADLRGATLAGRDLSGARLMQADLSGANLVRTDLTAASLRGARVVSANLFGAVLKKANLAGANLEDSDMRNVNAVWAFMPNATLSEANLSGANLSGANLSGANLFETILAGANLSGAYMAGASLDFAREVDYDGEKT